MSRIPGLRLSSKGPDRRAVSAHREGGARNNETRAFRRHEASATRFIEKQRDRSASWFRGDTLHVSPARYASRARSRACERVVARAPATRMHAREGFDEQQGTGRRLGRRCPWRLGRRARHLRLSAPPEKAGTQGWSERALLPARLCSKSPSIMRLLEQQGILFQKSIEIVVADRTKRRPSSCRTGRNNCEWLSCEIGSQWLSLSQNELDLADGQDRPRHMELRARGHSLTV